MCPEPIRDYVGEALARSLNGKAGSFGTDSSGNDATSSANRVGFDGGDFQFKATEVLERHESRQQEEEPTQPPSEPQWRRGSFTAEQLQARFPPTSFLAVGIIPAEGVTLLCSKPKFGKSWLAYDLCIGCTMNRITLGEILPAQGDVLYLALEDSKRRLQQRMSKLLPAGIPWPTNLTLKTEWRRLHEGGLDDVRAWHAHCKSNGGKPILVVIDVLAKVRKPTGNKQLYEADYEALAGLTQLAGNLGIAIVVVHHTRKMASDDLMETVSGSFGISGAVDTILVLANKASGAVLDVRGRDVESRELAIEFNKESCRWRILGMATEVHLSDQRGRVLAALEDANEGLAVAEIVLAAQLRSRNAADILLFKMTKSGDIERVKRGVYGIPGTVAKLAAKNPGKIGKKERSGGQTTETAG
jgi:AAA domain